MTTNTIHLDKTGAFLFRKPVEVTVQVNRDLAVIFAVPSQEACGIVVFNPDEDIKELHQSLETLYQKLIENFSIKGSDIQVKLFGLRSGIKSIMEDVIHWIENNGMKVYAKDTGGNTSRKLLVQCATGRVGINYSDQRPTNELLWIAEGSARNRSPMDAIHAEVLILTENSVKRTLAKQAIEEEKHWSASTPKKPYDILGKKTLNDFPWSVVLLFEDIDEKIAESWMSRVRLTYPAVQFRWIGTTIPALIKKNLPDVRSLPPIEPALLPEFKKKLRTAVFDHAATETSAILKFRR